ncbi:MAG TPA: polysaccharide biosynthesis tyrosine autokinase, partial [Gemmatimonadales bacterium]|nr:polysaccharide biosynthesis tyrosine autokinase [Gemmatimonadales bacterium]
MSGIEGAALAPYVGASAVALPGADMAVPRPASGTPITRIIAALRRFAWLIGLITVVGTAASVAATRILKPEYAVSATIWIETNGTKGQIGNTGPIQAPGLLSSSSWIELLRSFTVLDPVVHQMKLYLYPGKGATPDLFNGFELAERFRPGEYLLTVGEKDRQYTLRTKAGVVVGQGAINDSVGRQQGFKWLPGPARLSPGLKAAFTVVTPREASQSLSNRLITKMAPDQANFLRLSLTGGESEKTAITMNAIQKQFVDVAADLKKEKLRELSNLLSEQVRQQDTKLRESETALERFRVATITQPKEDVPIAPGLASTTSSAYSRYFQQRVDLDQIRQDRKGLEAVLQKLQAGEITVDAFQTVSAVRNAPDLDAALKELTTTTADLRALRTKYTDEHKLVKDALDKINTLRSTTIPTYALALIGQLRSKEADLESRIAGQGTELQGIPVRAITEGRLRRDMEMADGLAKNLQARYEEAKLAEISAIPDIRVLDNAVAPTHPSKNQAPIIIMVGFLASITVAVALALLLDRMDKRFRYPEQASNELGLSILGAIPVIPRSRNGRPVSPEQTEQVVEAFRSVRLNLTHSFDASGPACLTISSPSPGDGKSLISANLALSFAEAGYRTLLIDGDIRRGELHRTFATPRRPGLLDYLSGAVQRDEIFQSTSHARLTLIPCGVRLHHGPELLGSARMAELLSTLKNQYEVILIDSPPLGAGVDPFVLGTHTGNLLLVLRS